MLFACMSVMCGDGRSWEGGRLKWDMEDLIFLGVWEDFLARRP